MLACLDKSQSTRQCLDKNFAHMCIGSVAAANPQNMRRRAESVKEDDEIRVFRHYDCIGVARRVENLQIQLPNKIQISQAGSVYAELLGNPRGQGGRELSVNPDDHATSTG